MINKRTVKHILGELPLTAELYWRYVQRGRPLSKKFSLRLLADWLPSGCEQAIVLKKQQKQSGRRILIFSTLRYWIDHTAVLGVALAGLGHQVWLAYLPYANFRKPISRFDLRRQNAYANSILQNSHGLFTAYSLLDVKPAHPRAISSSLMKAIHEVAIRDTQYSLQIEEVEQHNHNSPSARLYRLRLERNLYAAAALLGLLDTTSPDQRPEMIITPNGSVVEMGAVYQVAKHLKIPVITYEFGEQRGRIWFAQDSEVMLQDTNSLWAAQRDLPLSEHQWEQIRSLYSSRQNANLWKNFARLWQGIPSQGSGQARHSLGLDNRPVVLLAANVIGDSLTLGRQVFTQNMTEWLQRSVQYFVTRPDVQLVVRIHPGERYLKGPSVANVVENALSNLPAHIRLIQAQDPINTYDLFELTSLGLAYTTTVGMEMAMSGIPVVLGGKTHYREKGFTLDPGSWQSNIQMIENTLSDPVNQRLSRQQTESAWNYAYRFFFDYPMAFPWHLLDIWEQVKVWPIQRVLSDEGLETFGATFDCLTGSPRDWSNGNNRYKYT